eukprot:6471550-Amphidinium_carterae.3
MDLHPSHACAHSKREGSQKQVVHIRLSNNNFAFGTLAQSRVNLLQELGRDVREALIGGGPKGAAIARCNQVRTKTLPSALQQVLQL